MDKLSLKDFIDFVYTLVNMEEVTEGKFPAPKEMCFDLEESQHEKIQYAIHKQKDDNTVFKHENEFFVEVFDVTIKFTKKSEK
jgi:hypothetical protein